jgi:hypothetical protein
MLVRLVGSADKIFRRLANPHTLALRLRAVRKSCTTTEARIGDSRSAQHSSSSTMLGCPVQPEARCVAVCAINRLIARSSRRSSFSFSTLK